MLRLLFLTLFLLGLGYLALLPPFEGFDETAHYASLRQIADTGTLPLYGRSFLPRDVVGYRGPSHYESLAPPFDNGGAYPHFFDDPALVTDFALLYRSPQPVAPFAPSDVANWQAQHPPLYYLLLAPVLKAVEGLDFVTQIFILRLVSYLLALGGIGFGLAAARRQLPAGMAALGFALYPLMLPMLLPEFLRIGNDSLCLLLTGVAAYCLTRLLATPRPRWALALGVTLGLGLLTKALFLPITLGIFFYMFIHWLKAVSWKTTCLLLLTALPALLLGGGWYVYKYLAFGELTGSDDAIRLARQGGLWLNLQQHGSIFGVSRGIAVVLASWVWGGTWSLARLPPVLELPVIGLLLWTLSAALADLRHRRLSHPRWLPVLIGAVFAAGLFYHILISVALNGNGNTPGWYLHILLPWVAPMLAIGAIRIARRPGRRHILLGLLAYAIAYHALALWAEFALFTGCAVKGDDKLYRFTAPDLCLGQFPVMAQHSGITGWPFLAAIGAAGGFGGLILLLILAGKRLKTTQPA